VFSFISQTEDKESANKSRSVNSGWDMSSYSSRSCV